jgi:hypothetical protein
VPLLRSITPPWRRATAGPYIEDYNEVSPDSRKTPNSERAGQTAALLIRSRTRFVEISSFVRIRRHAPMLVPSANAAHPPSFHWG